uniref:XK-related protein n=1 Tax=Knipowitschia caucasica TaxID=637954 RepID=A0AAV2L273_KNICA
MGFYLWKEVQWCALTLVLFLPGSALHLLSLKWFNDDGDSPLLTLTLTHVLHLGILKRSVSPFSPSPTSCTWASSSGQSPPPHPRPAPGHPQVVNLPLLTHVLHLGILKRSVSPSSPSGGQSPPLTLRRSVSPSSPSGGQSPPPHLQYVQPQCHMNMSFGNDAYQIKMTHVTADCTTPGSVDHSDQPQCHMNTSFANDAPQKQMTHVTADCTTPGSVDHSDQPQCHMNTSFANDAPQKQMTHVTADCTTPGSVDHSDQPQCHMNTSFANDAPQKQPQSHMNTSVGNDANQKQILAQHTWEVDYVPKLIRTKSVIMKDTNHLDCEFYDSTMDSSDNYVPDTSLCSQLMLCLSPSGGRLWDCVRSVLLMQESGAELGAAVMQQADVAALWLLEALVLTLPQSLLQAYVLVSTDVGLMSPVALFCGLCLLSLSWALVLFSRACCLIRPGHLAMPPAALLCQLLWRFGMIAARVTCLMFFARVFRWWVCGVAGFHWLTASFWLVSQQSDICTGPWCWRAFNAVLGLVHVFLFLNVKDGPSRFRMASFYAFMLVENITLVLAAFDLFSEVSWDNMTLPTAVLSSFLIDSNGITGEMPTKDQRNVSVVKYLMSVWKHSEQRTSHKGKKLKLQGTMITLCVLLLVN